MRSTFKVLFYVKKGSEKPNGAVHNKSRLATSCLGYEQWFRVGQITQILHGREHCVPSSYSTYP